jgi:PhnB protein
MKHFSAYISFDGNCRDAMTFYKECLGGELTIQEIMGSPIENQCPPEMKDHVMHSTLANEKFILMASDMSREKLQKGNNIGLLIACSSEEEIKSLFSKFSEGGKITDPLKVQFWGDTFGELTDKFGIRWMFNYGKN